jgi:hypothetical protein
LRRYAGTTILGAGTKYGTSTSVQQIRVAISSGAIRCTEQVMTEMKRLDVIAGEAYGDSSLWWVIAAASNIGWGMQVPPGVLVKIPRIDDIGKIL